LTLARLLGDAELLLRLQLSDYADRIWNPIGEEFARYGLAVLSAWLANRTIFGRVKARTGYTLTSPPEDWLASKHAIDDLASMTVVFALRYFKHRVLIPNRWDPARGASLRTYFVGQCLFQFANVYKSWLREEQERRATEAIVADDDLLYLAGGMGDVEHLVVTHDDAVAALAEVSTDRARQAFVMKAAGYSHAEIADAVGLADQKSVENLLGYQVRRLRQTNLRRLGGTS
jgi:DNA-directed RNA polymerase specialized sigma24 family protein